MKTLLIALLCFLPLRASISAETLAEHAAKAGTDWMIGKWKSEDGRATVEYAWKLDKYAVGVKFKLGERESEGMIVRKPGTDEIVYAAADNAGGVTSGKWIEHNGHPTLVSTHKNADGAERKTAAEHIKTDGETMTVKIYSVESDDKPASTPSLEVIFKRQP